MRIKERTRHRVVDLSLFAPLSGFWRKSGGGGRGEGRKRVNSDALSFQKSHMNLVAAALLGIGREKRGGRGDEHILKFQQEPHRMIMEITLGVAAMRFLCEKRK